MNTYVIFKCWSVYLMPARLGTGPRIRSEALLELPTTSSMMRVRPPQAASEDASQLGRISQVASYKADGLDFVAAMGLPLFLLARMVGRNNCLNGPYADAYLWGTLSVLSSICHSR